MKKPTTVRIKGAKWEALASTAIPNSGIADATLDDTGVSGKHSGGYQAKRMLLDLAIRHFRGLELTSRESKRLASALRRAMQGEVVNVGPVGPTGRTYIFQRLANAISIRASEGRMRLPLDAAVALTERLKVAVGPRIYAKAS